MTKELFRSTQHKREDCFESPRPEPVPGQGFTGVYHLRHVVSMMDSAFIVCVWSTVVEVAT